MVLCAGWSVSCYSGFFFFFSSRRRHTRFDCDWSSDVCSSDLARHPQVAVAALVHGMVQTVLQGRYYGRDLPLGVSLKVQDRLDGMAPDWPESDRKSVV